MQYVVNALVMVTAADNECKIIRVLERRTVEIEVTEIGNEDVEKYARQFRALRDAEVAHLPARHVAVSVHRNSAVDDERSY